jgi:putative ABC transport system permease protein
MNFSENFRIALRALAANKLRSALTMLGIIIGVGAVVALMALGNGATAQVTSQIQDIGSNVIFVFPGNFQRGEGQGALTVRANLFYADYEALIRNLHQIVGIAPTLETNATVTYGAKTVNVGVTASTPQFGPVRAYEAEFGRFLAEADGARQAHVVVLGSQTAKDLFGGLNPVGRTIKVNGVPFEVVGVLKSKGSSGFGSADEMLLIPLQTGYAVSGRLSAVDGKRIVNSIYLSAASPDVVNDVMVQTERILRRQHRLKLTDELDFTVLSQTAFLEAFNAITATLTAFLGAIGAISLVVGGIGVMNIMLVSVTERTREIGLRKAVGAKRRAILLQFLMETVTLTFIGGLIGLGLGWAIAAGVTAANLLTAKVDTGTITIAFVVTAVVGIVAGVYPAFRASRLNPIDALRYE